MYFGDDYTTYNWDAPDPEEQWLGGALVEEEEIMDGWWEGLC